MGSRPFREVLERPPKLADATLLGAAQATKKNGCSERESPPESGASFTGLVLGCIEAEVCNQIFV